MSIESVGDVGAGPLGVPFARVRPTRVAPTSHDASANEQQPATEQSDAAPAEDVPAGGAPDAERGTQLDLRG